MRNAPELHGERGHFVLNICQAEVFLIHEVVIQVQAFVFVLQHPVARSVAGAEKSVYDHFELARIEPVARFAAEIVGGAAAVIRREYDEYFMRLEQRINVCQELFQILIEPVVHVFGFDRFGAVGLADRTRGVEADVQQVGPVPFAEVELCQGRFGELKRQAVACRRIQDVVVAAFGRGFRRDPFDGVGRGVGRTLFLGHGTHQDDVRTAFVAVFVVVQQGVPRFADVRKVEFVRIESFDPGR